MSLRQTLKHFMLVFTSVSLLGILSMLPAAPASADKATDMFVQDVQDQAAFMRKKCGEKPDSSKTEEYNAWNSCYINYSYFIAETCPTLGLEPTNQEKIKHYECKKKFYKDDKSTWDSENQVIKKADGGTYMSNPDRDKDTGPQSCGGVKTVIIKCSESDNGVFGIVLLIINILATGVAIVAIGGFVFGAIKYASAQDNASQVSDAKRIMFNVTIGLVLFALMYSLLQFIIPGGIFDRSLNVPGPQAPKSSSTGKTNGSNGGSSGNNSGSGSQNEEKCYDVKTKSGSEIEGNMFHGPPEKTYAFENSPAGIRYAAARGYDSIDLDTQITKDGVVVITHWDLPLKMDGFYDPSGKIKSDKNINDMTIEQVRRLRNKDGESQIYSLEYMAKILGNNKMNLSLEVKTPKRFKKNLPEVVKALNDNDVKAIIKGAIPISGMDETLTEARKLGFWTRGTEGSQEFRGPKKCSNDNGGSGSGSQPVSVDNIRLKNLRDASATSGNSVLKKGVLYRSAKLQNLNDKNIDRLAKLLDPGSLIVDVRTKEDASNEPDPSIPGTNYRNIPISGILDQEPMVTDPARRSQIGVALKTMANAKGDVLLHCFAGKDRTGWLVAMIMYVNGASDAQVMKEYMKSQEDWPDGVKKSWLDSGTSAAKRQYGSINGYLKRGVGLSDADINKIKQKFGA